MRTTSTTLLPFPCPFRASCQRFEVVFRDLHFPLRTFDNTRTRHTQQVRHLLRPSQAEKWLCMTAVTCVLRRESRRSIFGRYLLLLEESISNARGFAPAHGFEDRFYSFARLQ